MAVWLCRKTHVVGTEVEAESSNDGESEVEELVLPDEPGAVAWLTIELGTDAVVFESAMYVDNMHFMRL